MEPKDYIRPERDGLELIGGMTSIDGHPSMAASVLPGESTLPMPSALPAEAGDTLLPSAAPTEAPVEAAPSEITAATQLPELLAHDDVVEPAELAERAEASERDGGAGSDANEWFGASALPSQVNAAPPPLVPLDSGPVSALVELHGLDSDLPSGLEGGGLISASGEDSPSPRTLEVLRAIDPSDPRLETVDDPRIPAGQMYFKIGEVSKLTGIKPYVLRYWEVEFPWIRPEKTSSRQRRYRRQDIALLFRVSRLRYQEQLTIEETRQAIREDRQREGARDRSARGTRSTKKRAGSSSIRPGEVVSSVPPSPAVTSEVTREETALFARAAQARRTPELVRALADMRTAVLELLEAVEE